MLKRHRSSVVELLPDDVVELILERLPVESLRRFKSVSNKWKSTIASRCFQERQLIRRMQSRGPDVLFVYLTCFGDDGLNTDARRIVQFGSSIVRTVRFPASGSMICHGSCDGLLCIYCFEVPSVVVNPATGWSQRFPLSNIQQLLIDKKLFKSSLRLPFPIYVTLATSPCASLITTCAFPRKTGPPKSYGH
ncbi:predicted protein [Arabidopsis lyrata subsp. lyrata]|uniref:Predicted protein n=1 Tax=Arabidopsis lyrata subsp. lyrata TaxID=81972 RepID=D7KMC4_ARALL|nr:predicted protein [Arabidopsis lyrata subsp. lyrata]